MERRRAWNQVETQTFTPSSSHGKHIAGRIRNGAVQFAVIFLLSES